MSRINAALAVSLALLPPVRLCADGPPNSAKLATPADRFAALVAEQQKAQSEFSSAYNSAGTEADRKTLLENSHCSPQEFAPRFLALAREFPTDPAALEAYRWIITRASNVPEAKTAADLVIQDWVSDPRLETLCKSLVYHSDEAGNRVLRAAIEKSPHRPVQGYARYSLATALRKDADRRTAGGHVPVRLQAQVDEAERLFKEVIDGYAELKFLPTLGKAAEADLYEMKNLSIGKAAPEFEGGTLDGKPVKLSDYRGKVLLVVFWGTWCGPCMADLPHEQELFKKYDGRPFTILGIDCGDNRAKAVKTCADKGVTFPSVWDGESSDGPVQKQWNVRGWPTLYLLDTKGVIRFKGDYLRGRTQRKLPGKDWEAVVFLDESVELLVKEAESEIAVPKLEKSRP
jgi:thiol-disulfide isomerase/thioredoxin